MDDTTSIMIGVLSGAIGTAYFVYGKKQSKVVPLIAGVALMVVPYMIPNPALLALATVVLLALPFVIQS